MADSAVPITAGTGTNIDTFTQAGGDHRQAVVAGDPTNSYVATVMGGGFLRVTDEPTTTMYDPFDASIDTTNTWTSTTSGGGVAAAITSGSMVIGTGTTANGYSSLTSQPTFKAMVPAWLGASFAIALTDGAAITANTYRFWGIGTAPVTPSAAAPLTDAAGFEISAGVGGGSAGRMYAVVYAGGTRTAVADLFATGTQPANTSAHRYGVYYRTDRIFWFIDTLDNVVASASFQGPAIQTLPVKFLTVANTSAPITSATINCLGVAVWDTGKNASGIKDATFGWRQASVSAAGALSIAGVDNENRASTLAVTVTAAVGVQATLTLPAVAGQFHYITSIDIILYSSAARTGAAAPWLVTSTNLPGSPVWTFSTAGAIGVNENQKLTPATPLKSSAVNTATTIVGPAATGGIWRITATYFTAT